MKTILIFLLKYCLIFSQNSYVEKLQLWRENHQFTKMDCLNNLTKTKDYFFIKPCLQTFVTIQKFQLLSWTA